MNALLGKVLDAHGGIDRWMRYTKVATNIIRGGLFALKVLPQDSDPRCMTVWLREQRASVHPFGAIDQRTMFTPDWITIEKLDGSLVTERLRHVIPLPGIR